LSTSSNDARPVISFQDRRRERRGLGVGDLGGPTLGRRPAGRDHRDPAACARIRRTPRTEAAPSGKKRGLVDERRITMVTGALGGAPTPTTRYARSGDLNIAYQVFGAGPPDIVLVPGFISHVEFAWHEPLLARFLRRLSAFTRVIAFDKRGMGLSDRDPRRETPSLAERMDDIAAVMDTAGCPRAALLAWSEGGPASLLFARRAPERVAALILVGTAARFTAAEDYPEGIPRDMLELFIDAMRQDWGTGVGFEMYAPNMADDARMRSWWASYQRFASSPGAVAASLRMHLDVDVRHVLPDIAVPTLIMHRTYDMLVPVECASYTAARVTGARYLEQPGEDHMYWLGDQDGTLSAIRDFLAGTPDGAPIATLRQSRRRPAAGWESLTEAEMDVVRLVTAGMTNRQIAERLYLSPRTIQTHVSHIMRKLGIARRSEIAAETSRRQR
jgi:pimeloyl-ACP methyl ester carboxylesterase/DNA-binding CsgD family transcriptional regulator